MYSMSVQQALQNEIEESKRWIESTQEDSTYILTNEIYTKELN
jgi:hypothetical protein